jgi:hypothetical protein
VTLVVRTMRPGEALSKLSSVLPPVRATTVLGKARLSRGSTCGRSERRPTRHVRRRMLDRTRAMLAMNMVFPFVYAGESGLPHDDIRRSAMQSYEL